MGTLWSELGPVADAVSDRPRVYADANVPAGIVTFMRERLQWDVLSVMEHPDLRRARDTEHFRLARQLRRTLVTLDRDYLDDRTFPPAEGAGVLVIHAPNERGLATLLARLDAQLFGDEPLPLDGRTLHAHSDWGSDASGPQKVPRPQEGSRAAKRSSAAEGSRAAEGTESTDP